MASENGWYTKFPAKLNRIDLENKKFDLEGFMPKGGLCSRSQRWTLIEDDMKMWKKGRVELLNFDTELNKKWRKFGQYLNAVDVNVVTSLMVMVPVLRSNVGDVLNVHEHTTQQLVQLGSGR